jgi:hypothetical protein
VRLRRTVPALFRNRKFTFVSPGVVSSPSEDLGFSNGFLVRNSDGHVVELAGEWSAKNEREWLPLSIPFSEENSPVTQKEKRMQEATERTAHWKRWEPYLSERAWGTVREDYSSYGTAWDVGVDSSSEIR